VDELDPDWPLGCELVAGLFESEGDRLLSLLLLELLPPSPPVLLPVQEEANTWLSADCMSPVRPPVPLTVTEALL